MSAEIRNKIINELKAQREKLSASSLKTYVSRLASLPKHLGANDVSDIAWFGENVDAIINQLVDKPPQARKSVLSALFVLTNSDVVHSAMLNDAQASNNALSRQEMSVTQKTNWITWEQVNGVYEQVALRARELMKLKKHSESELGLISDFVLLSMFVLFPPRRSEDYGYMTMQPSETINSISADATQMTFRKYKTLSVFGIQTFPISGTLKTILKKWKKINPSQYLIYNKQKTHTDSPSITRMFNRIFGGKKVSVSMLRHAFLSDVYGEGKPNLSFTAKTALADKMAHGVRTAELYAKNI